LTDGVRCGSLREPQEGVMHTGDLPLLNAQRRTYAAGTTAWIHATRNAARVHCVNPIIVAVL
jgi:hypothetical protein